MKGNKMEKIQSLLDVLNDGRTFLNRHTPPKVVIPTVETIDINVSGLVVSGQGGGCHLHAFSVGDPLDWALHQGEQVKSPRRKRMNYCRLDPLNEALGDAWKYVHHHFKKLDPESVHNTLYSGEHGDILTSVHSEFNLQVMCILATYVQETPYIEKFTTHAFYPNVRSKLESITNRWYREGDFDFPVYFGGQALAHVLLGNNSRAFYVDVWVQSKEHLRELLDVWRKRHISLFLGSRPGGVIVACLPQVSCSCIVRVVPPSQTYHELWRLQPDFTQCMFTGTSVVMTPRCLLAIKTGISHHPPTSTKVWVSAESGLKVKGPNLSGKPAMVSSENDLRASWEMLTQFGCVGVSLHHNSDHTLVDSVTNWVAKWGFGINHIPMDEFLSTPGKQLGPGSSLYIHIDRMIVDKRVDNVIYVNRDRTPGSKLQYLDSLIEYMVDLDPGRYRNSGFLEIHVHDFSEHAVTGGKLNTVPVNSSISGIVRWNFTCIKRVSPEKDEYTLVFGIISPRVHPGY
jgi:hypothetical protein